MTDLDSGMVEDQLNISYSSKREATPEHPAPTGVPCEKLYVGHLPFDVSKREMDDLFGHYGTLINIEIKHGGYAFVQYENSMDAENAVEALHNYLFEGKRLTVEFSNKKGAGGDSCLICGLEGHWARDCPDNQQKGLDVKSGKCFRCGSFGHLARFCRNAAQPRPALKEIRGNLSPRESMMSRPMSTRPRSPIPYRQPEYPTYRQRPVGGMYDHGYYPPQREPEYYRGNYDPYYEPRSYYEPRYRDNQDYYRDAGIDQRADARMDYSRNAGFDQRGGSRMDHPRDAGFDPRGDSRMDPPRDANYDRNVPPYDGRRREDYYYDNRYDGSYGKR